MAGSQGLLFWGGICFIYFLKIQISSQVAEINQCIGPLAVNCGKNAECVNTGELFHCSCTSGYILPYGEKKFPNPSFNECQDDNECTRFSISCGQNADCINTVGSYHCRCYPGYALPSGKKIFTNSSIDFCEDVDECQLNSTDCGSLGTCVNHPGRYDCTCKSGFSYKKKKGGYECLDDNECARPNAISCGEFAECVNTPGSYHCTCISGYALPSGEKIFPNVSMNNCQDDNECTRFSISCGQNADCINTVGSYHCRCYPGYALPSGKKIFTNSSIDFCEDVDECQLNSTDCGSLGTCVNHPGRYDCTCKSGFSYKKKKGGYECLDDNECARPNAISCGKFAECVNTPGSYHCTCISGYALPSGEKIFPNVSMNNCQGNSSWCSDVNKDEFSRICSIQSNATNSQDGAKEFCKSLMKLSHACENDNASLSLKDVANIFDILPGKTNENKNKTAEIVTKYLETVQNVAYEVALSLPPGNKSSIKKDLLVIQTLTLEGDCDKNNSLFKMEAANETMNFDCILITEKDSKGAAVFISYASIGSIINERFVSKEDLTTDEDEKEIKDFHLNSKVVSGTIGYKMTSFLSIPVSFTFQHIQMKRENEKSFCVYWRNTTWSTQGCEVISSNDSQTECSCSHLSSFAILLATTTLKEDFVLTMITYVGLGLSLLCLFLAALVFLLCRAIQNISTFLHLQLSLCLFLANLLFLIGIEQTQPKIVCSIIAGGFHYLYLAAFIWMFLEGLYLFLTVRNLKVSNFTSASQFKKKFMYSFGYGIPAVIVAVSAGINPQGYGRDNICWLKMEGFIWSFLGPVFVIILINLSFYLTTLWILRDRLSSLNKEVSTIQNSRTLTFKALAQLFILGCSWSLGFFLNHSIPEPVQSIIAYTFTIINSLQGVYIFLVHCVLSRQVQEEFKKRFKRVKKRTETDIYVLSTSTGHSKMSWGK